MSSVARRLRSRARAASCRSGVVRPAVRAASSGHPGGAAGRTTGRAPQPCPRCARRVPRGCPAHPAVLGHHTVPAAFPPGRPPLGLGATRCRARTLAALYAARCPRAPARASIGCIRPRPAAGRSFRRSRPALPVPVGRRPGRAPGGAVDGLRARCAVAPAGGAMRSPRASAPASRRTGRRLKVGPLRGACGNLDPAPEPAMSDEREGGKPRISGGHTHKVRRWGRGHSTAELT